MRYLFITLLLATLGTTAIAQDYKQDEGALRTGSGYLLYNMLQKNSFTIELSGDVDLSAYPIVKYNDKSFEFEKAAKSDFGSAEPEVLQKFMALEKSLMEDKLHSALEPKSELLSLLNRRVNFWHYAHPQSEESKKKSGAVLKTYFMDFANGDLLFRVSYPSASGNDAEARQFLQGIVSNFRFYKSQLDFDRLSKSIESGVNYYTE